MKPYYQDGFCTIYHGDCLDVLPGLSGIDTVLTDPPYGLKFMAKEWDHGVPGVAFWQAIMKSCKPGAMMMAFGGTRTHHRLMCSIEDAGWQIRDVLMWVYGSGFPKSLDIGKAIDKTAGAEREIVGPSRHNVAARFRMGEQDTEHDHGKYSPVVHAPISVPATNAAAVWAGWGTALKPAWEPIVLAMKALAGTYAANAVKYGVAGLNIDGSRIGTSKRINHAASNNGKGNSLNMSVKGMPQDVEAREVVGRWPANVIHDGSEEVMVLFPRECGAFAPVRRGHDGASKGIYGDYAQKGNGGVSFRDDRGTAARFFYCAKATNEDRGPRNNHPTVKPRKLMKYLCRLTSTPTGGLICDPFMGSGTTLVAAKHQPRHCIGIETEERYCEIAANRLAQEVFDFSADVSS